jgi:hypothetical protein
MEFVGLFVFLLVVAVAQAKSPKIQDFDDTPMKNSVFAEKSKGLTEHPLDAVDKGTIMLGIDSPGIGRRR